MGKRICEDGNPVARNDRSPQEKIDKRSTEEHHTRHRIQEVYHRVEVTKPLRELQSWTEERIIRTQNLNHPAGPANALTDVRGQALGGQPGCLWNVDVGGVVPAPLHAQRSMSVLGNGFGGDSSHFIQRRAPYQRAGTAKEGSIPKIIAILDDSVKQFGFVGDGLVLK